MHHLCQLRPQQLHGSRHTMSFTADVGFWSITITVDRHALDTCGRKIIRCAVLYSND